jgi:hypothetical protein
MTRTLWFRTSIGASEWSVYLADPSDPDLASAHEDESPNEGAAFSDRCIILINRSLPRKRWAEVLMHEVMHGAFHVSGTKHSLRLSEHREEQIILGLAPMLTQALIGARMLKMPRKPRETE